MALLSLALTACASSTGALPDAARDAPVDTGFRAESTDMLDLLLEIDNSGSMRENQSNLLAQLDALVEALVHPPEDPATHRPAGPAVRSLHVGVISSDLGSPGSSVRGCDQSDIGDDGLLNPIRSGQALARHEPWTAAPAGFRPEDCGREDQFPSFIAYESGYTDSHAFAHDAFCTAALYVNGCGLEQQLEAVWRALVYHRADDAPGNADPNAGFLRDRAVLAILVLSDEEDGSVRDCRYAEDGIPCTDGTGVFNSTAAGWSATNLNMRFYMYQPCSTQDPNWTLDRYLDPRNPDRGYLRLKPGHPERVLFAAITGVPLRVPTRNGQTDWDALLGPAAPGAQDDFCARAGDRSFDDPNNAEGPISMHQANRDSNPNCTDRTVPACRREGASYDPANPPCSPTEQYFAWPGRRIIDVARRFDQTTLCHGSPCHNGMVASICANDYAPAIAPFVARIRDRLGGS